MAKKVSRFPGGEYGELESFLESFETEGARRRRIVINSGDGCPSGDNLPFRRQSDGWVKLKLFYITPELSRTDILFIIYREEFSPSLLRNKLGELQSLDLPLIPDFLHDDDEELEEGLGLTLPATPLDSSPSDSEVWLKIGNIPWFKGLETNWATWFEF